MCNEYPILWKWFHLYVILVFISFIYFHPPPPLAVVNRTGIAVQIYSFWLEVMAKRKRKQGENEHNMRMRLLAKSAQSLHIEFQVEVSHLNYVCIPKCLIEGETREKKRFPQHFFHLFIHPCICGFSRISHPSVCNPAKDLSSKRCNFSIECDFDVDRFFLPSKHEVHCWNEFRGRKTMTHTRPKTKEKIHRENKVEKELKLEGERWNLQLQELVCWLTMALHIVLAQQINFSTIGGMEESRQNQYNLHFVAI